MTPESILNQLDDEQRAAAQEIDTLQKKISALIQKVELVEAHSKEYPDLNGKHAEL